MIRALPYNLLNTSDWSEIMLTRLAKAITLGVIVCCASCVSEINTQIELLETIGPPTFKMIGSGVDAEFLLYGPYQNCAEEASISTPLYLRQPIWQISPIRRRNNSSVSEYSPLVYGAIPNGYEQVVPQTASTPNLVDGKYYLLWVRVNSASSNFVVFHYRDKKAYKCK